LLILLGWRNINSFFQYKITTACPKIFPKGFSENKGSRSAGRIFEENGIIKRPAQDSSKGYGYGVVFYQINTINETDYQENEINSIYPDGNKNIIGIHTFSRENKLTMIDMRIKKSRWKNNLFQNLRQTS